MANPIPFIYNEASMKKIFKIESIAANLRQIREDIRPLLETSGFDSKVRESILVAVGEACTNAIRHAYLGQPGYSIEIIYEDAPDKIVISVRDFGKKINLQAVPEPKLPPERPGGLGIHFMKTIMDQVEYNTAHSQGNELILTKFKKEGAPA